MTKSIFKLNARLMFEVPCPVCGKPQDIPAAHQLSVAEMNCSSCGEMVKANVEFIKEGRSSLKLLEIALGKWLNDILPVCGDVKQMEVKAELMSLKPLEARKEKQIAHEEEHRASAGLDIPNVNSLLSEPLQVPDETPAKETPKQDEGLLTSYSMGSATGVDEISKLLRADPGNRQLKEWLAFAYYRNNELKEAVKTYLELIEDDPADVNSHYYLANSYFKLGYNSAAAKGWEKVQAIAPDSPLAKKAQKRALKVA